MGNGSPPASSRRAPRSGPARLRARRRLVLVCCATALLGGAGDALPAGPSPPPVDVCIALDPLLRLGCTQQPHESPTPVPAPAAGASQTAAQPAADREQAFASAPVAPTWSAPRYDPRRLTVTFKSGTARSTIAQVFRRARVTVERAVPKLRASSVLGPELRLGPHSDKLCFSLGRHAAKRSFANVRPQAELGTETHSVPG